MGGLDIIDPYERNMFIKRSHLYRPKVCLPVLIALLLSLTVVLASFYGALRIQRQEITSELKQDIGSPRDRLVSCLFDQSSARLYSRSLPR